METGDVVQLDSGSVGVVSEVTSTGRYRIHFPEGSYIEVSDGVTLPDRTFAVDEEVTVWPHIGVISSVRDTEADVELARSEKVEGVGYMEWRPVVTVPLWRLTLDNDARLGRVW